jgi:hypothetical protein
MNPVKAKCVYQSGNEVIVCVISGPTEVVLFGKLGRNKVFELLRSSDGDVAGLYPGLRLRLARGYPN